MDKVNKDPGGETIPYRLDPAPIRQRQRDVEVTADQLRWYINGFLPEGEEKDRIHRDFTLLVNRINGLIAAQPEGKEGAQIA